MFYSSLTYRAKRKAPSCVTRQKPRGASVQSSPYYKINFNAVNLARWPNMFCPSLTYRSKRQTPSCGTRKKPRGASVPSTLLAARSRVLSRPALDQNTAFLCGGKCNNDFFSICDFKSGYLLPLFIWLQEILALKIR
jgi:hypothetical protein